MTRNRCCTYPQGEGLILPQALMVMAVFSNLMMFNGMNKLFGNFSMDFLCVMWKIYIPDSNTNDNAYDYGGSDYDSSYGSVRTLQHRELVDPADVDPDYSCEPLTLFNTKFWDGMTGGGLTDEQKGYHAAWQAAAALGAIAAAIGAITLVVLLRSVCFDLKRKSVITVAAMQGLAAVLSLCTLSAGALDVCQYAMGTPGAINSGMVCERAGIHLETGAGFAIAAFVFYILALVFTLLFLFQRSNFQPERMRRQQISDHNDEAESFVKSPSDHAKSNVHKSSKNGRHKPKVTVMPDGSRQIERSYVDANGQIVTETTIEQSVPV